MSKYTTSKEFNYSSHKWMVHPQTSFDLSVFKLSEKLTTISMLPPNLSSKALVLRSPHPLEINASKMNGNLPLITSVYATTTSKLGMQ